MRPTQTEELSVQTITKLLAFTLTFQLSTYLILDNCTPTIGQNVRM